MYNPVPLRPSEVDVDIPVRYSHIVGTDPLVRIASWQLIRACFQTFVGVWHVSGFKLNFVAVQVRWEDQKQINEFGGLNTKRTEQRAKLDVLKVGLDVATMPPAMRTIPL